MGCLSFVWVLLALVTIPFGFFFRSLWILTVIFLLLALVFKKR